MGYRPQTRSPRKAGRGHRARRHSKAKAKGRKRRSSGKYLLEENHVPTTEEIVEKSFGRLRGLGNQIFAVSPFSEYFDDWLVNLKDALIDFESNPAISVDDQFIEERSRALADVERELEERKHEESAREVALTRLAANERLLERIEQEYANSVKEIEGRKNSEIKHLSRNVQDCKEELDRITQMKAGIFRSLSKRDKAQKEAEATQRLNVAQSELELATQNFAAELEKLRNEFETRRQLIIEQVRNLQKKAENIEIDVSLEIRRTACEALVNAVKALLQRRKFSLQ